MKKILTIILACTMMLSLAACGAKDDKKSNVSENATTNEFQETVEKETETEEKEEDEDVDREDKESDKSEESKKSEEDYEKEDEEQNEKSFVTIVEGSNLKTNDEYSGLYQIGGYMRANIMGNLSFSASVSSIEKENYGDIDLSKANLSSNITNYFDFIHVLLKFENNEIVDWDFVDRKSGESVLVLSDEELLNKYFPETNFEIVDAGELPEIINLSNYEVGKTYAFDVSSEENFSTPSIINDTDIPLLIVSIKNGIDDDFEREYKPKHAIPDNSVGSTYSDDGKYYVAITEGDPSDLLSSDECFLLASHEIGEKLDFDFEDYIGNNTDKTITILISDWGAEQEFKLLPGEVLESSWMNDATIINIE